MTTKSLLKMEKLKQELLVLAQEIRLKQAQHQPVALLRAEFYKAQQPYRALWIKKFKEESK
jgi:hypothetical protein